MENNIWELLEVVRANALNTYLGGVMNIASILACIAAAYMVLKNTRAYVVGMGLDLLDFMQPILILLLVCNFDTLVLGPINALINIAAGRLAALTNCDMAEYVSKWAETINKVDTLRDVREATQAAMEMEEYMDANWFTRSIMNIWIGFKKSITHMLSLGSFRVTTIICGILFLIVKIALFLQQIMCTFYLIFNSIIGALSLALSIFPTFGGSFKGWIARHIQISMWIPAGYVIMGIHLLITETLTKPGIYLNLTLGMEWVLMALQIAALCGIFAVPKLATWFVEAMGVSDTHRSFGGPIKAIAQGALMKFV